MHRKLNNRQTVKRRRAKKVFGLTDFSDNADFSDNPTTAAMPHNLNKELKHE